MFDASVGSSRSTLLSQRLKGTLVESLNLAHLHTLTDGQLMRAVENLRLTNRRLEVESDVWQSYLGKVDPKALQAMEKLLRYASVMSGNSTTAAVPRLQSQLSVPPISHAESISSLPSQASGASRKHSSMLGSFLSGVGPSQRMNITMRLELVQRDREANETALREFVTRTAARRLLLRSQLEELALQLSEIKEARDIFEQTIVRDGVDPLTGRIPAEKFVRYMEEWLKSADSIVEKLRLRTNTLRYRHVALKHQLKQKEQLGETLHPVDFDHMKINNKILVERIATKNEDLLRLKQKAGHVNLLLAKRKRTLQRQLQEVNRLRQQIETNEQKRLDVEREGRTASEELVRTEATLGRTRELITEYTVPELLDYVRVKKELDDLRKTVKVWGRRNHLQRIALDTCVKTMRRITRSRVDHRSWFELNPQAYDDDL